MALTIEDGTGVDGADSFITVTECSDFATAYFGHSLTGSNATKEASLRRAFARMAVLPWAVDGDGDSLWPTFGGTIPQAVKNAQAVFARVEFQNEGALAPVVDQANAKVLSAVGSIQWTVKPGPTTVEAARKTVLMAEDFLNAAGLLQKDLGGVAFLERA